LNSDYHFNLILARRFSKRLFGCFYMLMPKFCCCDYSEYLTGSWVFDYLKSGPS
jgi:hypothetical protein